MNIYVGSTNPVKIQAVTLAASKLPNKPIISGIDVPSGVRPQPMTDEETKQGAENRARAALTQGLQQTQDVTQPALGLGLEGGVCEIEGELWSTVWIVVVDQSGQTYAANGARFKLPAIIADQIRQGKEMGVAMSELTKIHQVNKKQGMIGVVTKEYVTRESEYAGIAQLALGLWYGRDWQA